MKTTCDASRCFIDHYPYHYPYADPYYDLLNNNDFRSTLNDISFNHPTKPTPEYPVVHQPVTEPIVHRDDIKDIYVRPYPYPYPHPHTNTNANTNYLFHKYTNSM